MGWLAGALSVLALAAAAGETRGPTLRVGLSVAGAPQFPEPGRRFVVAAGPLRETLRGPLTVRAEPPESVAQVGVFSQEKNARALAVRLQALGFSAEVHQERDQHRVWVVPPSGVPRGEVVAKLREAGFSAVWVVRRAGTVEVAGGEGGEVRGEVVTVEPVDPPPVVVGTRRYRGSFLCLAGERGPVIVNRVALEDYLAGVVPAEMGPKNFPNLEALKAQAVAARSYALAQRGTHAHQGFDLCDQEHCQVYLGADGEDPLASQAVAETAGLVLSFGGKVVRAYFHSTCGGRTEAGSEVFAGESAPYLRGVPCFGEVVPVGRGGPPKPVDPRHRFRLVGEHLAGKSKATNPLALAQVLGGRVAQRPEEALGLPDLAPLWGPGVSWRRALGHFRTVYADGISSDPWQEVLALAQVAGVVRVREGVVVGGAGGPRWREIRSGEEVPVGEAFVLWRGDGGFWEGEGEVLAGSRAWLWCTARSCPVVEVEAATSADVRSAWRAWVREWPAPALAAKLGVANVSAIQVVQRTASGRAARVVVATGEGSKGWSGAELRRLLGLPSTWFVVGQRQESGAVVYRFFGKGWGHGVGLCQNGAYGLSLGGWTFERILAHYYPGTALVPWQTVVREGGT